MAVRPHPTKSKTEPGKHWYIDLGRGKARQRIHYKGSYEEAVAVERSLRQSPDKPVPTVAKISELIVPFLNYYRTTAAITTVKDATWVIEGHLVHFFGSMQPRQITPSVIENYKQLCLGKDLSKRTINKHLSILSSIIKWAVAMDYCQPLVFKMALFPSKQTKAAPVRPLTKRQIDAIFKEIEPEYKLLFLLMSDMGLRRNEAMNLMTDDVNESNRTISVKGKGSKYRTIPWTSTRLEEEFLKALEKRHTGPLVLNTTTDKAFYSIRKALIRAAKIAGIDREIDHHLLRHTFLSLAAESGVSPHALQQIAGHSSIETTNKIYTHVGRDFVRDEVKKIKGF